MSVVQQLIGLFAAWCSPKSLHNSSSKTLQKLSRSFIIQSPLLSCKVIISILVIVVLENQSQHTLQSFANSQIIVILALPCSRCYEIESFGIEDPKIQRRLLVEPDLSFDNAFELALASESADQNAKDLQAIKSPHISLNRMQIKQAKPCYRCGVNHKAIDYPHKSSECHKCGKKGHFISCV